MGIGAQQVRTMNSITLMERLLCCVAPVCLKQLGVALLKLQIKNLVFLIYYHSRSSYGNGLLSGA